jgi:hypothetical protein
VRDIELLNEISSLLYHTRILAAEAGRFTLCYLIDTDNLETDEMLNKQKLAPWLIKQMIPSVRASGGRSNQDT